MEHINTLCGQNLEFQYVKAGGTYSNHYALKTIRLIKGDDFILNIFISNEKVLWAQTYKDTI
jgi:hypothetical protein